MLSGLLADKEALTKVLLRHVVIGANVFSCLHRKDWDKSFIEKSIFPITSEKIVSASDADVDKAKTPYFSLPEDTELADCFLQLPNLLLEPT